MDGTLETVLVIILLIVSVPIFLFVKDRGYRQLRGDSGLYNSDLRKADKYRRKQRKKIDKELKEKGKVRLDPDKTTKI